MAKKKNMRRLRELPKFGEVIHKQTARIRDYSGRNKSVHIEWDLNAAAIQEQVFKIVIEDKKKHDKVEILLDKQELMHYLRAV